MRLLDGAAIHLVNTDPPYNVKVEPRSNNAIAAGLSSFQGTTHHQGFDVERHPEKATATHTKMRAKDRPLMNDFVSEEEFDRLLHAWFGNMARVLQPGRAVYIWGGYANIANYPAVLKAVGLYFSPDHHLGQGTSRADTQGLHGQPRVVLLYLAGRRRPPVLSVPTTPPTCGASRRSIRRA